MTFLMQTFAVYPCREFLAFTFVYLWGIQGKTPEMGYHGAVTMGFIRDFSRFLV